MELSENQIRVGKKIVTLAESIAAIDKVYTGEIAIRIKIENGQAVDVAEDCKKEAIARAQSPANEW